MSIGRHACRVAVVKTVFAEEFREQPQQALLDMILEQFKPIDKDIEYIKQTIAGIFEHLDELKAMVAKYAPERPVAEINPTNRAILYMGAYEILYADHNEIPQIVAINEAIEVARELSDESGIAFVNGVLNKINEDQMMAELRK
ncbi:MAG: transcription antitermination factor NusB [Patescibacteria group bacterium]|nr:transcription antitermination factor NusB [Patescibacteria group bacterium]